MSSYIPIPPPPLMAQLCLILKTSFPQSPPLLLTCEGESPQNIVLPISMSPPQHLPPHQVLFTSSISLLPNNKQVQLMIYMRLVKEGDGQHMAAEIEGIVRWRCWLNFKFRSDSGDGLRLYIDDEVWVWVISRWRICKLWNRAEWWRLDKTRITSRWLCWEAHVW